jgi:myosin-7
VDAYCDPILGMGSKQTTDDLIKQVEGISISQYAERYFNFDRKGIFGKRTTMDKILSWKPDVIRTSLRTLNSDMVHEATQSFRNITGFMGDRSTGKGTIDHAQKLLNNMLLAPEELRDEIFCQMVKQTNNNPSTESCTKGWQLMLIALAAFPPSAELQPHLMAYCVENLNSPQGNVPKLAELALHKIQKIVRLGPRREIPTKLEMEALRDGNPVVVRVWFLDDKYTMLKVDSWLTAEEFEEMIAHKLGIQDARSFSIFEVSSTEEERVLDADERILDLVAYWQRMEAEERQRKGKGAEIEEFKFFFKVRLFFDVEDDDTSAIEMMYIQAKHDVVDARYPCTEQDSVTLAALQVQEEFGDCPSDPSTCTYLRGNLDRFVAARYFEDGRETEIESQIMTLYGKLTGYSQLEARLSYLDYVKSWKIYGSSYYFAEPQNNREFPSEVVLAINNKGILVVDPETKDFLAEYPYQNVVTWGHSANSFVVVTGNMSRQVKVYFKTDQGKEMNQMVRQYVENIMS